MMRQSLLWSRDLPVQEAWMSFFIDFIVASALLLLDGLRGEETLCRKPQYLVESLNTLEINWGPPSDHRAAERGGGQLGQFALGPTLLGAPCSPIQLQSSKSFQHIYTARLLTILYIYLITHSPVTSTLHLYYWHRPLHHKR